MNLDNILPSRMKTIMILYHNTSYTQKITHDIDLLTYFEV